MTFKQFVDRHRYKLIFVLVSFILYGATIRNDYGLDDEFVTGPGNLTTKGLKAIPRIFRSFHVEDESHNKYEYRPLVKVSYAVEHQFFGVNVHVSHFINILLYAISLIVLLGLLKLLFINIPEFTLFCIVLAFAFLPVHSEVVVSLKNRDVLLSFIFTMLAFRNALHFIDTKKWYYLPLMLLNVVLAFLSKYDILPYILIIPVCIYIRDQKSRKYIIMMLVLCVVGFYTTKLMKRTLLPTSEQQRIFQYFENPLYFTHTLPVRISAALNSLGFYFKMLVFPSKMSSYYGYKAIDVFSYTSMFAVIGLLAAAALAYLFFRRIRKPDLVWYGTLLFLFSISMYLNFVMPAPGIVADRFMFFASVGFAIIAVHFLFINGRSKKYPAEYKQMLSYQKLIAGVILLCYTVVIMKRNGDWTNRLALFEADSKNYPGSVKLGLLCASQVIVELPKSNGLIPESKKPFMIRHSEQILKDAVQTDPGCTGCYNNLSFLLLTYEHDPAQARPYLIKGVQLDSTKKELVCNLGIAYLRLGKIDSAEHFLRKSIELDPENTFMVPYEALQSLYMTTNIKKGIEFFKGKVEEYPNSEFFNIVLAKSLFDSRDTVNGIHYYKRVLEINPANRDVSNFVEAVERYQHRPKL